jgi:peptidylprolyl isomerase
VEDSEKENELKIVALGSTVKIHFEGRLGNGEVFDSTEGLDPIMIKIGAGNLLPKFEEHLMGMKEGENRTFTIRAADAYGPRDENLEKTLMRSEFPPDYNPGIGDILAAEHPGVRRPVRVKALREAQVVMDLNHPLAGEDLIFTVTVIEIASTTDK